MSSLQGRLAQAEALLHAMEAEREHMVRDIRRLRDEVRRGNTTMHACMHDRLLQIYVYKAIYLYYTRRAESDMVLISFALYFLLCYRIVRKY